jgi:uncharacterized protein (TIGR03086 family)
MTRRRGRACWPPRSRRRTRRWRNPEPSTGPCTCPFGDTSGQEYVVQLTADLAIHAWDLARATGQDDTLDLGAAALLLPWAEANAGLLTASCMFGSPVDTRPDPPDDVRLPGLLGRRA